MKKNLTALVIFCMPVFLNAQNAAIGTNPQNPSAALEINANNKGLLIPRMLLTSSTDAATVPAPAPYLMLYNTNASTANGLTGPGLYVNTSTPVNPRWQMLGSDVTGGTGRTGDTGSTGPVGAKGHVVNGNSSGAVPATIAGNSFIYVFAGTPATVTTNAT